MYMKERRDVTRTKKAIENAYIELLIRKGYERITVNEVIELADVSRGTFYAHYRDIPDLEDKVEEKVLNVLREACVVDNPLTFEEDLRKCLEYIFDKFCLFREDFKKLLSTENNSKMFVKIKKLLVESMGQSAGRQLIIDKVGENSADLIIESAAGAFVEAFAYWVQHDDVMTREFALKLIGDLFCGAIEQAVNKK